MPRGGYHTRVITTGVAPSLHITYKHTDIKQAPWYTVEADDKRRARLNCIAHILSMVSYEEATPPPLKLAPRRPLDDSYVRPPKSDQNTIPDVKL